MFRLEGRRPRGMGSTAIKRGSIGVLAVLLVAAFGTPSAHGAFPGDNGKIAYNRGGDIYAANPDGSGVVDLTLSSDGIAADPAWSADGKKIAFTSDGRSSGFERDVYVMNADGSNVVRVTAHQCGDHASQPAWSPDGSKILFYCDDGSDDELYQINVDGSGFTQLTNNSTVDRSPAWSPDGTKIAFADDRGDIYTINPDGTNVTKLTTNPVATVGGSPNWSPDGSRIAFFSDRDCVHCDTQDIYTVKADGSDLVRVTNTTPFDRFPAWAPDGSKITFATCTDPDVACLADIYTVNPDGSGATTVVNDPSQEDNPDWQPLRPPGYPRVKAASPTTVHLVPAVTSCSSPNGSHGAPLALPSCGPGSQSSSYLTVGTPDAPANGQAANSTGYVRFNVLTENPIDLTNGDQSDIQLTAQLTDVRQKATLADYTGELRVLFNLRLTDRLNGAGNVHPATTVDTTFGFNLTCATTPSGSVGSTCSASTTADAVVPSSTPEQKRSVWQMGKVEVYDGGSDGDADTPAGNTLFATQGIYAP
jgi:dipeptidyl aminopeptidase/acylaminoacyl peptidase